MDEHPRVSPSRPRPVALPAPATAPLGEEIAKAWVVALLESRPLSAAAQVPVADLVREAPALCDALLRAVESDRALDWLLGAEGRDVAARSIRRAGGGRPGDVVATLECLRRGAMSALAAALPGSAPELRAGAAERVAHVCAQLAAAAVADAGEAEAFAAERPDALAELALQAEDPDGAGWPAQAASAELHRFEPRSAGRPVWMAALERQLADGGRSGRRFALLLVEVDGAERLRLADAADRAEDLLAGVGRTIRERVRRADLLAYEDDGRVWVIAPDAGRAGATALAARLAGGVERTGRLRGTPLRVSIGISVFPEDGRDAAALSEHAEEQMFAARASGRSVVDGGSDEPASRGF